MQWGRRSWGVAPGWDGAGPWPVRSSVPSAHSNPVSTSAWWKMLECRLQAVSSSDAKPLILAASPQGLQHRLKAELQHPVHNHRPQ